MGVLNVKLKDPQAIDEIAREVSHLQPLERRGKEIATAIQTKSVRPYEGHAWARSVVNVVDRIINSKGVSIPPNDLSYLYRLKNAFESYVKYANTLHYYDDVKEVSSSIIAEDPSRKEEMEGMVREANAKLDSAKNALDMSIYELDRAATSSSLGGRCTYMYGEVSPDKYNISLITNDLTTCLHNVISSIEASTAENKVSERCYVHKGSDPSLVEACKEWDHTHKLLLGEYERPVYGVVKDGTLTIKLGEHHSTVDKNTNKLTFYDPDLLSSGIRDRVMVVKNVFKELCKAPDVQCRDTEDGMGIECSPVKGCEKAAAIAIAAVDLSLDKCVMRVLNDIGVHGTLK